MIPKGWESFLQLKWPKLPKPISELQIQQCLTKIMKDTEACQMETNQKHSMSKPKLYQVVRKSKRRKRSLMVDFFQPIQVPNKRTHSKPRRLYSSKRRSKRAKRERGRKNCVRSRSILWCPPSPRSSKEERRAMSDRPNLRFWKALWGTKRTRVNLC